MADSDHYGYVYFDREFKFKDGNTGEKLFIVLCTSPLNDSKVVVVRTTSQERGAKSYGCHLDDRWQNFYLPEEAKVFEEPTWIMLDYAIEYPASKLGTAAAKQIVKLGPVAFKDLLDCAAQATDIEQDIRTAISKIAFHSRSEQPTTKPDTP